MSFACLMSLVALVTLGMQETMVPKVISELNFVTGLTILLDNGPKKSSLTMQDVYSKGNTVSCQYFVLNLLHSFECNQVHDIYARKTAARVLEDT